MEREGGGECDIQSLPILATYCIMPDMLGLVNLGDYDEHHPDHRTITMVMDSMV